MLTLKHNKEYWFDISEHYFLSFIHIPPPPFVIHLVSSSFKFLNTGIPLSTVFICFLIMHIIIRSAHHDLNNTMYKEAHTQILKFTVTCHVLHVNYCQ